MDDYASMELNISRQHHHVVKNTADLWSFLIQMPPWIFWLCVLHAEVVVHKFMLSVSPRIFFNLSIIIDILFLTDYL